jgi:hypothetical protein
MATAASSAFSATRASPSATATMCRSASGTRNVSGFPNPRSASVSARRRIVSRSEDSRGERTSTRQRERSAFRISKDGFSVVVPNRVTVPSSTDGSSASCCALFHRWISSMKRMAGRDAAGPPPARVRESSASASRISLIPDRTAE